MLKRLYWFLPLELLYYVNKAMAVYRSYCSGITSLCPDPGVRNRGDRWVHFVAEGKSFCGQFGNFFCKMMDVFIHANLETGSARMGAKKTLYYLSSMYSPADFMLTDLSCYWKGLNNVKECLEVWKK